MTWVSNIKQHVLTSYYWISDHDFMHTLIHHYMHYAVYIILTFILTATTPGTTINFAVASFRYVTSSLTCFRARRERAISRKSTRLYTNSDTYAKKLNQTCTFIYSVWFYKTAKKMHTAYCANNRSIQIKRNTYPCRSLFHDRTP
jgi:hypothetical protein